MPQEPETSYYLFVTELTLQLRMTSVTNELQGIYKELSFLVQQPNAGQGRLILEASRSHTVTPQSVGLLWTRDRPVAVTST